MVCTNSWKICCINKDSSSVENIRALDATFIYLWVPGQAGGVELLDVRDGLVQGVVPGLHPIDVGLVSEDDKKRNNFLGSFFLQHCTGALQAWLLYHHVPLPFTE